MTKNPLSPTATLFDVVNAIEQSRRRIAVVVSSDGMLLGTLTDGDIRRCLLAGGTLETPAIDAMNVKPVTAHVDSAHRYIFDLLRRSNVMTLPLIDSQGRFVKLVHVSDLDGGEGLLAEQGFENAVIMAGGEGLRLRPVTESIPKPMVEIGGIPLLQRQIERLMKFGVRRVFISVNYLSHVIEDYFKDGTSFGVEIAYLRENQKLGTAGALSLLPSLGSNAFLVMNGDVLTTSDFVNLYQYHHAYQADITMSVVDYHVDIPFGVVEADGPLAVALKEKPSQRFLCNAGIYVLSPQLIDLIPSDRYYDMTELIHDALTRGYTVAVFPLHEYWTDIGNTSDLESAQRFFGMVRP